MTDRSASGADVQGVVIAACRDTGTPFLWHTPGCLLVDPRGVRAVLARLRDEGHPVIGLEGFEVEWPAGEPVIRPRLDRIYDAERSPREAMATATSWEPNVWIDITIGSSVSR